MRMVFTLGHEFCGRVVEVGPEIRGLAPGDRVVAETHLACGHCRQCRMNRRHTCDNLQVFSRLDRGGFAEMAFVPGALLRRVPDGISDALATLMEPLGVAVRATMTADLRGASVYVAGCGLIDETWLQTEALLGRADVDFSPVLTHAFRLEDFEAAFETARSGTSGKVRFVMDETTGT